MAELSTSNVISLRPGQLPAHAARESETLRGLLHSVYGELLDVMTLLHAAADEVDQLQGAGPIDDDCISDPQSRATALLIMADKKTREAIQAVAPYV